MKRTKWFKFDFMMQLDVIHRRMLWFNDIYKPEKLCSLAVVAKYLKSLSSK